MPITSVLFARPSVSVVPRRHEFAIRISEVGARAVARSYHNFKCSTASGLSDGRRRHGGARSLTFGTMARTALAGLIATIRAVLFHRIVLIEPGVASRTNALRRFLRSLARVLLVVMLVEHLVHRAAKLMVRPSERLALRAVEYEASSSGNDI